MNPRVMDNLLVEGELLEEVENKNEKVNDYVLEAKDNPNSNANVNRNVNRTGNVNVNRTGKP